MKELLLMLSMLAPPFEWAKDIPEGLFASDSLAWKPKSQKIVSVTVTPFGEGWIIGAAGEEGYAVSVKVNCPTKSVKVYSEGKLAFAITPNCPEVEK